MDVCAETVFHPEALTTARRALAASPVEELADTFKALGDPTRVRILIALASAELCVCDLAKLSSLSVSAVSHQLRLLRTHRLVRPRRDGKMMYYSLDDGHVRSLFEEGLRHVEERRK